MPRFYHIFWFLLFWMFSFQIQAQLPEALAFQHIGKEDGLSQGEIEAFCRDHLGLMWIGTRNGLNVWDGYEMTVFFNEPGNPNSLGDNGVWDIVEDPWGDIWMGNNAGLNRFNRASQTFDLFLPSTVDPDSLPIVSVMSLLWGSDSTLWIGGYAGAYKLEHYHPDLPLDSIRFQMIGGMKSLDAPRLPTPLSIMEDSEKNIWFSTTAGIIWLNPAEDDLHYLYPVLNEAPLSLHNVVVSTVERRPGEYWVSLNGAGAVKLTLENCPGDSCDGPQSKQVITKRYTHDSDNPRSLGVDMSTYYTVDPSGRLWCGTARGISVYNPVTDDFDRIMPVIGDPESVRHQSTYSLYSDREGIVWVGTREGISYYHPAAKPFKRYYPIANSDAGLNSNHVEALFQDSKERIWVSTQKSISRWDPKNQTFFHYPNRVEDARGPNGIVKYFHEDEDGMIWLCGQGSLIKLNPETAFFTHYKYKPTEFRSLGTRNLFDILPDGKGGFWLGSYDGILHFDPKTEEFIPYEEHNNWNCIDMIVDRFGTFWAAGGRILYQFDIESGKFTAFKGYGTDTTTLHLALGFEFHEDQKGRLWLGTDKGLIQIDQENQKLIAWDQETDLPFGVYKSIEEDESGNLWLGTALGVYRLTPETKEVVHYDQNDGLHGNTIYNRCSFTLADGSMIFGGEGGFTRFQPNSLKVNGTAPAILFTDFKVFNESALVSSADTLETFFLPQHISTLSDLFLSHSDQIWEIHFAATDLTSPDQNQYRYRLIGFDEDWVEAGTKRAATYTNLFEGTYTFEVQGSNNDGIWSDSANINIHISPPWYRTWWAYLSYFLLIAGLGYWAITARLAAVRREERTKSRIAEATLEEREKTRARSSRDFHDEAGNRLTKISLYTGLLQQQLADKEESKQFLAHIEDHTRNLSSGMRDFIWVLDPQQDQLSDTLGRLRQFGEQLFADTGIVFQWKQELPSDVASMRLDVNSKRHLLMIFKEGMHNALKYANASTVTFWAGSVDEQLTFKLQDDGLGFDQDQLVRINGLHNMESRAREMEAEFTVNSVPGLGTTLSLIKEIHPNG